MSAVSARLAALRAVLSTQGWAGVVVPSADPHLSEYMPERWQGRIWLSGFTGSVGTVVVTREAAGLWVDSRYWEQAAAELRGTGIMLMKVGEADVPEPGDWLAAQLRPGDRVVADGQSLGVSTARKLSAQLAQGGVTLLTAHDPLDLVWTDRPGLPDAPVYEHDPAFAPTGRVDKLAAVRERMRALGAAVHVLSALDDIAWLTNLRGSDVAYNPVFLAHALIGQTTATLFVPPGKIDLPLRAVLEADGFTLADYDSFEAALGALDTAAPVLVDPGKLTHGVLSWMPEGVRKIEGVNPSTLLKACKTDAELAHVRDAMAQDGAALCEFFQWFDTHVGRERITELTVDEKLSARRQARPGFVSLSFPTIAGFNANGAMPHYRATPAQHSVIDGDGLLLIDSGAQYVGGTTDITRVVAVGTPSDEQKRDFTLVLKGMINLSRAVFPRGIAAPMLDALARAPIWAGGADYGHGTGHGVGYFLNVHEGPQVISYRAAATPQTAMQAGMITSNEPGIYRQGRWGVRIENLVANVPAPSTEMGDFLAFETLTLCPIDTRCILPELLDAGERMWLDAYHDQVRTRIAPLLSGEALVWLQERCAPFIRAGAE